MATDTLVNTPKLFDAAEFIQAHPSEAMTSQDSGIAAILSRNAELRCAVRWYASLGKTPASREKAGRKAMGDAPVTTRLLKLAVELGNDFTAPDLFTVPDGTDPATGKPYVDPQSQIRRNTRAGALTYAAALVMCDAPALALVLENIPNAAAKPMGFILTGTAKNKPALASWKEFIPELNRIADEVAEARKARKARAGAAAPAGAAGAGADAGAGAVAGFDPAFIHSSLTAAIAAYRVLCQEARAAGGIKASIMARFDLALGDFQAVADMFCDKPGAGEPVAPVAGEPVKPAKPSKPAKAAPVAEVAA